MVQLIKQVLKSFKNSILLLFGLVFIGIAIIFASTSSLYFSSNVSNSYKNLHSVSNNENAIAQIGNDDLLNSKSQSIYDLSLDLSENSSNILSPDESGVYFQSYEDYANYKTSFMYQPASLSKMMFSYTPNVNTYIFPYYVKEENGSSASNPYFAAEGINDPNQMFVKRAKGILKSYGEVEIPQGNSSKWRAEGAKLTERGDPQYIIYEIDPFTGLTKSTTGSLLTSVGYFSDGLLKDNIVVYMGSLRYPTNVTEVTSVPTDTTSLSRNNQLCISNADGTKTPTPFFATSSNWNTSLSFDLTQYGDGLSGISKILSLIKNGADPLNIISSISLNISTYLPLVNIDWDVANFNPYYEYLKIFHDKNYITESKTTSFGQSGQNNSSITEKNKNDLVFNIHVDESKLTNLQKETLEFVKQKYGYETYSSLVRFTYTVNTSWIKNTLISENSSNQEVINYANTLNFDNLSDLTKDLYNENEPGGENIVISGETVLNNWLSKYSFKKQDEFNTKMAEYEKEYLASRLSENENISFNIQKSFTISDSETSNRFLVSRKNSVEDGGYESENVNQIALIEGTKLENSTKYLDVVDKLFEPYVIQQAIIKPNAVGWSPNSTGSYLINLVKFIAESEIENLVGDDYQKYKELSQKIVDDYYNLHNTIDPNDYYKLFAMINVELTPGMEQTVSTNNQVVDIKVLIRGGTLSGYTNYGALKYATPYGNAAIVTQKWLETNNKKILSSTEWQDANSLGSEDYFKWLNELPNEYKFKINSRNFVIIGIGQSAENAFPIVSIDSPIPNPKNESLIFVNDQGYESILSTNSTLYQDEYFAIKFNNSKLSESATLKQINDVLNGLTKNGAYLATDTSHHKNLLTLRYSYPLIINNYVQIFATVLAVLLIIVGVYLCFLMIKIYVEKNQTSLAIIKANGMPTWKIILALSMFGMFVAIFAGILGYVGTYFAQYLFLDILGNYWFIPIAIHSFSMIGFFGGGLSIYFCILLFIIIGILVVFKQPINSLISQNAEVKVNKLLYLMKSQKVNLPISSKFTFSLILNKIGKFILFTILCSFGLSIISVGVSTPLKFTTSKNNTEQNRLYDYSFDLVTPTEQSGLYKLQPYEDLGATNTSIGVGGLYDYMSVSYWNFVKDPYYEMLQNPTLREYLALRDLDGNVIKDEQGNMTYFTNLLLPSYAANSSIKYEVDFLRNGVFTKWLLDFDINVVSLSINAWDLVKQSLSDELVARIDTISNEFVMSILDVPQLKKANEIGNGTEENPKPFLTLQNGVYKLQSENVISDIDISNLRNIRLNNNFLKFIGMVYGDKTLSAKDTKISYGIIPTNDNMETYTYINAYINNPHKSIPSLFNNKKTKLVDISEKIMGINPESKYVTLIDDKGNDISNLITEKVGEYYPVIINKGASLKYNLNVGDEFDVTPTNTYDRYSKIMYGDTTKDTYKFKVVGISSDSFSTAFYTSQYLANEVLKMNFDQGSLIITDYAREMNVPSGWDWSPQNYVMYVIGDQNEIYKTSDSYKVSVSNQIPTVSIGGEQVEYVPFNGVFSNEQNPLFLSNVTIESDCGLWGNFTSFLDPTFEQIAANNGPMVILDAIIPYQTERLMQYKEYLINNGYKNYAWTNDLRYDIIDIMFKKYPENRIAFWNYLNSIFSNNVIKISINSFDFFKTVFGTYTTIFETFITIQNLLISILMPIIIMIMMIVSSVMVNEFKTMLAMLKTLGYSDKQNFKTLMIAFMPVLIISLLLGFGILTLMIYALQTTIFNLASIYLSSSINFIPYLYGAIAVVAMLLVDFVYIYIYLKKQNLRNAIS